MKVISVSFNIFSNSPEFLSFIITSALWILLNSSVKYSLLYPRWYEATNLFTTGGSIRAINQGFEV